MKKNIPLENKEKFSTLVHYIVWYFKNHIKGKQLDIVKLNKLLWIIDTRSYCLTGHSVSGQDSYIKRKHGPVPHFSTRGALKNLQLAELIDEENNAIDLDQRIPRPGNDANLLIDKELETVRQTCKEFGPKPTQELVDLSHDRIYEMYQMGEEIPLGMYLVAEYRKPTKAEVAQVKKKWAMEASQLQASALQA